MAYKKKEKKKKVKKETPRSKKGKLSLYPMAFDDALTMLINKQKYKEKKDAKK